MLISTILKNCLVKPDAEPPKKIKAQKRNQKEIQDSRGEKRSKAKKKNYKQILIIMNLQRWKIVNSEPVRPVSQINKFFFLKKKGLQSE